LSEEQLILREKRFSLISQIATDFIAPKKQKNRLQGLCILWQKKLFLR